MTLVTTNPIAILIFIGVMVAQEPAGSPGWATLTLDNGALRVSFPARPQKKSGTIPSAAGSIRQTVHYLETGGCQFTVQEKHYPRAVPSAQVPAQLASEKRAQLQGQELFREKDINVDGVEGEEFEFKGPSPLGNGSVTSRARHFLKGAAYYTMTVMSAPDQPPPPETGRFMGSIHFGAPKATPTRAESGARSKRRTAPKGRIGAATGARAGAAGPAPADDTPEAALRSFLRAMRDRDEATLRSLTLPGHDGDLEWLMREEVPSAKKGRTKRTSFAETEIRRLQPGDRIGRSKPVRYYEVNEDHAVLLPEAIPIPTRLQRVEGHWKVDARRLIAERKAAEAAQQKKAAEAAQQKKAAEAAQQKKVAEAAQQKKAR
jgi:hypothetical protein